MAVFFKSYFLLAPDANEIIHLNDITAEVLEKVLEWCTRHSDYNDSSTGELIRMQWDQNFFDDNRRIIKRLGNAAKYFEIETLKDAISVYESQVALCDSSLKA